MIKSAWHYDRDIWRLLIELAGAGLISIHAKTHIHTPYLFVKLVVLGVSLPSEYIYDEQEHSNFHSRAHCVQCQCCCITFTFSSSVYFHVQGRQLQDVPEIVLSATYPSATTMCVCIIRTFCHSTTLHFHIHIQRDYERQEQIRTWLCAATVTFTASFKS